MKPTRLLLYSGLWLIAGCGGGDDDSNPTQPPGGGNNHAPTVNLNIDSAHLAYGGTAQLSVQAVDSDGDQVTFSWSAVLGTVASSGPTSTTATFTAGSQWGQASVTVTASDGKGGSAQATSQTYIRNPNPPAFQLFGTTSSTCGTGTANPYGFVLRITPPEAVTITHISMKPQQQTWNGPCTDTDNYATPIQLTAGQQYPWTDGGCINPATEWCSGVTSNYWSIVISGKRSEPDGGTYYFECDSWDPSNPSDPCNN